MNKLNRKIKAKRQMTTGETTEQVLPVYADGGVVTKQVKRIPYRLIIVLSVIFLLAVLLYLPEILYKPQEVENRRILPADIQAVKLTNEYTRDCPEDDFDGDGLLNYLEQQHGTSSRRDDTDGDGISDYAEIYMTETNPTVYDEGLLERRMKKLLEKEGKKYSDPYKLENVVLWADDVASRAFGAVVKTQRGYRIYDFSGWVEFPEKGYAYAVNGETYELLEYKENSNAWRIDGDTEVCLSVNKLSVSHRFRFIKWQFEMSDNFIGKTLSFLLPDNAGILTCKPETTDQKGSRSVEVEHIMVPDYEKDNLERYGMNHNSLTELGEVYALIDDGSCVLASLNSSDHGETLILIYGYSEECLLIADPKTGEHIGKITTIPCARSLLTKEGKVEQKLYFNFRGLGYDSQRFDRIHFIAASITE